MSVLANLTINSALTEYHAIVRRRYMLLPLPLPAGVLF